MSTSAAATRKLAIEVSDLVLDIEDVLLSADALPAELLQPLADDLSPFRERLRRHLANLIRAKQAAKKPPPVLPTGKPKPNRTCSTAARR